jgi:hypothetical protein
LPMWLLVSARWVSPTSLALSSTSRMILGFMNLPPM